MDALQEELDELNSRIPDLLTEDEERRIRELEEQVKLCKRQLHECRPIKDKAGRRESVRVSVGTSINEAIMKICKDLPEMAQFLTKKTIPTPTGHSVQYLPDPETPVEWILHPKD